ncbi:MAG: ABC transporter permease subunit [Acidimicrobiia bacterium]
MRAALTRDNVRAGLVGGVIVLYLALVGMIERFQDREVITGVIGLGTFLILIALAGTGYMAGRPPKPRPGRQIITTNPAYKGLVAGVMAGALSGVVILILELLINAGADVRSVLASVTPGMLSTMEFGSGEFGGALILVVLGAALGAGAGSLRLLSDHVRDVVTFTFTSLLLMSLLEPILGAVLNGLSLPERWLYSGGGLTVLGAILTVAIAGAGRWFWKQREPRRKEAVALLPAERRSLYRKLAVFAAVALLVVLPWIVGSFISDVLGTVGLYVLLGLGLNIVVGYAGLLDLGYVAFFAVGAYATGVLTSPASYLVREEGQLFAEKGFTNFWLALPFVVIIAVIIGILIGAPVLRLRGDYLAIVTLGFGEIIRTLVLSDWLAPYLGGAQGLLNVPPAPPAALDLRAPQNVYYLILVFCGIAAFVAWRLSDSRVGRAWAAMREDESVAEAMGVSIIRYKLLAFAMGAGVGSLGGVFFAAKIGSIFPNSFGLLVSINVLSVIILGGLGSIPGVIVGSAVLVGLPELLREFAEFRLLIYGAILVAIMILRPEGLIPNKRRQRELHAQEAEAELSAIVADGASP